MTLAPALRFEDVRKSYGRTEALRGVSFSVAPGEFVGLVGPNGSGKSTLFQIAAGLFAPDGGSVEVFGRSYRGVSSSILRDLGVVFQARSIDLEMSVRANLKFHGHLFGMSGKALNARIDELAGQLEIASLLKKQVRTLSGGNQRRVEIARALLNNPKLLLMDEPSLGLDMHMRQRLADRRTKVSDESSPALLWATHMIDELDGADRIVVIVAGQVTRIGTPAELMAETGTSTLAEAYVALTGVQPAAKPGSADES